MRIDHVIYATHDLDGAAARVEAQVGVAAVGGGRHDGLGTHNRIVSLGDTYIELLAICDADEAAGSPLGRALRQRIEQAGEGLMGWAVEVDDVQPVAARLKTEILTVGRQGRQARLTGTLESLRDPYLPFFIAREAGDHHPGAGEHARNISWIEVTGDVARLEWWLDGAALPVRIATGAPAITAVGVGDRVLG
jgi:hypothetical protein